MPRDEPVLEFLRLMWAVDHQLQSMSKRMLADLGLTGPQRLAVRFIGLQPGLAAGQLAGLLHLDPGTVTGILRRLEAARLITRERDATDSRRVCLTLTKRGQAINRRRTGTIEFAVRRALGAVSAADERAARRVLKLLAAELGSEAVR
jgi:MarR family transcriptional regulator, organic hydroperoxide resistance regulator